MFFLRRARFSNKQWTRNDSSNGSTTVPIMFLMLGSAVRVSCVDLHDLSKYSFEFLPVLQMMLWQKTDVTPIHLSDTQNTAIALSSFSLTITWTFLNLTTQSSVMTAPQMVCSSQQCPFVGDSMPKISTVQPQGW